jgi:hypothetical protein
MILFLEEKGWLLVYCRKEGRGQPKSESGWNGEIVG